MNPMASDTTSSPSPDSYGQLNPGPLAAIKFTSTFGRIVLVLMRTRQHRHSFLGDLEWLVMPAVTNSQFMLAEHRDGSTGLTMPLATVLWAQVSEEVDARLCANPDQRVRLKPEEWASGTIPWLIEAAGETHAVGTLLRKLIDERFPATGVKSIGQSADGTAKVRLLRKEIAELGTSQEPRQRH
jgi:hemolysin-activating ACP:hemolysin acyltransferase